MTGTRIRTALWVLRHGGVAELADPGEGIPVDLVGFTSDGQAVVKRHNCRACRRWARISIALAAAACCLQIALLVALLVVR